MPPKINYKLADPMNAEATMAITMKLKEWEDLKKEIADKYPGWQLREAITKVIEKAKKTFEEDANLFEEE